VKNTEERLVVLKRIARSVIEEAREGVSLKITQNSRNLLGYFFKQPAGVSVLLELRSTPTY
jgi:hypothetical protein